MLEGYSLLAFSSLYNVYSEPFEEMSGSKKTTIGMIILKQVLTQPHCACHESIH